MHGLYDPANEHDGCGLGLVARLGGVATHETVVRALTMLRHLEHRGAESADGDTGDGAGITLQLPDAWLRASVPFALPERGRYGVATCFLPNDPVTQDEHAQQLVRSVERRGHRVLGWRDVPVRPELIGRAARATAPVIRQLFIAAGPAVRDLDAFERELYVVRRTAEIASGEALVVPSCSARTIVYKGMLSASQLARFYPDLEDDRVTSALALVHSRFSTNTFPSWELAHPYRLLAHNGEVNTLTGNIHWMRAREAELVRAHPELADVMPILRPDGSDSAAIDNAIEFLLHTGRSLPHALMMLVPAAWQARGDTPRELADFYRYHALLAEPWDGPACIGFTDGRVIGATLDRNGLRPGRWLVTRDGWVMLASEAGTIPVDEATVLEKGRLRPGRLFVVDLERHAWFGNGEVELELARRHPYGEWVANSVVHLHELPPRRPVVHTPAWSLHARQLAFGWTQEDLRVLVVPLVRDQKEPDGSMGSDVPLAVLSDAAPSLFSYFKQRFAQVTNPAIDPVREAVVMSLATHVGPEEDLLAEHASTKRTLELEQPILRPEDLDRVRDAFAPSIETIDATWPLHETGGGLALALERMATAAEQAIARGATILVLSDRETTRARIPVPALLAVASVHHHLVRTGLRQRVGLVVDSGEPREVHHVACLLGYGANAVCPHLLFETLPALVASGDLPEDTDLDRAARAVITALGRGLLKIIAKMGISTLRSYTGAQVFEAIGLDRTLVDRHFHGTSSRIGGIGLEALAREAEARHARAAQPLPALPAGGVYAWRRAGELHVWNPETIPLLQEAVREPGDPRGAYARFVRAVDDDVSRRSTLRGLLRFAWAPKPVPLAEVEPARSIVKRFSTGAMSLGALSPESHQTLAIAMNRIGGRSNSGEGGEDPARHHDARRSAIKQVASGRFGVTIDYLVHADDLQIKIAQGAKPGEGGQLPGHKVTDLIARLRHATPGIELISPPPHHDIYSIEDLKQLIYDLRCANPGASVSVKLVSELGVGTVAAGVAKANADRVLVVGHDGGTGSSPWSSIHSAGLPWELGLAETQQTLVHHGLRSRVAVQVDGQMKTGRDVMIAALLGADEMGFSTAPLIANGCVMMRVCHKNTCPVGIATQDPELRRRFKGTPEQVINYVFLVAEHVRHILARLGLRTMDEAIGRSDLLVMDRATRHWKARTLDLSPVLARPVPPPAALADADTAEARTWLRRMPGPVPRVEPPLDTRMVSDALPAIEHGSPVTLRYAVTNRDRAVGGLLSSRIARRYGAEGLPPDTIVALLEGSAGQSFGAWLARGVTLSLAGEANDYVGKGLSGGVIAIHPPAAADYRAEDNVIVGNTVLYGATSGCAFIRGQAGERFAVRNSGADAVVEGVGDHGCEYMTGGRVVVLGSVGCNFAAGMSGGIAYVYDPAGGLSIAPRRGLAVIASLGDDDAMAVNALLREHHERTGSAVAEGILARWAEARTQFTKIVPTAFQRALNERLRTSPEWTQTYTHAARTADDARKQASA